MAWKRFTKDNVVKMYEGTEGIAPLILNFCGLLSSGRIMHGMGALVGPSSGADTVEIRRNFLKFKL
jgi:hypothetical protein